MITPATFAKQIEMMPQESPDLARDRPEGDEHETEADDERERIEHHRPSQLCVLSLQFFDTRAGDQRDVSWHQRQHARRQE